MDGQCMEFPINTCIPCTTVDGSLSYYMYNTTKPQDVFLYHDDQCLDYFSFSKIRYTRCNNYDNTTTQCQVYAGLASAPVFTLSFSSTNTIEIFYNISQDTTILSRISPTVFVAEANTLEGVLIEDSDGYQFTILDTSEDQYETNFGVYNYNQNYKVGPFFFIVNSEIANFPITQFYDRQAVVLKPFNQLRITEYKYKTVFTGVMFGGIGHAVYTNSDYNLGGLFLSNRVFNISEMTFTPQSEEIGTLDLLLNNKRTRSHQCSGASEITSQGKNQTFYTCNF